MSQSNSSPLRVEGEFIDETTKTQTHLNSKSAGLFIAGDTTPNVMDNEIWICDSAVVIITDFDNGQECQVLSILGHGNTTIKNNTNIATNTGADKVLAASKIYRFTRINSKWIEDA